MKPLMINVYDDPIVNTPFEKGGGPYLTETSGYIPKEIQLQIMMQSGKALDDFYRDKYPMYQQPDEPPVDPDNPDHFDPTTLKGFDIFDAMDSLSAVAASLNEGKRREQEHLKALEAKKAARAKLAEEALVREEQKTASHTSEAANSTT